MSVPETLQNLGWRPYFHAQLNDGEGGRPARVLHVHRGRIDVGHAAGQESIALTGKAAALDITVGDWVVLEPAEPVVRRRLERQSLFQRRAAGTAGEKQLIAANVDTLFIVTSANRDFNVARLERYLAIANDAGAFPVVVVTKADLADSIEPFVSAASGLAPGILVETLDAREPLEVDVLRPWCNAGQTVALLGSSGVGKSTLVGTLTGEALATREVREDDQRGRHTTSSRSMHRLGDGGWLIDTPGMRELQLVDVGDALDDVFVEIAALAERCRFADCCHESEPGCAVRDAVETGDLDPERLRRYRKLRSEDQRNTETLAERRARDKKFGRMVRSVMADKQREKGGKHQ
ncbi:MAG: ribosome small subunit-dependent GTPase A [Gammaproteobacteria bacterium]|nr:ribosome small subunit-dependent GTPase A [Gammaproteobacteria bacterium]NNF48273.1 ribosome small subunit-dependent GTPase A [Woeseiaceae bacterium]MBT8093886.1 ribosome small subunit-dependent GTPase A [Gammaproteobacteria bacterium]MBT8104456.1 ribosome small subunit-dependent GTPase A [Gammaproteobacteria bacterium]NNK24472.1 ribosome small subunit-dependent GTPase A [Woeseiaceae bacterium]